MGENTTPAWSTIIEHPGEDQSNEDRRFLRETEPLTQRTYTPSLAVVEKSAGSYHWTPEGRKLADTLTHSLDQPGIGRGELLHVGFQAIRVVIGDQGTALSVHDTHEFVVVDESPPLDGTQLLPDPVEWLARSGAEQVVDTAVEDVRPSFPGGAQAAGQEVKLKDLSTIAVHLAVTAGGQASDPTSDNNNRFFRHDRPLCRLSHLLGCLHEGPDPVGIGNHHDELGWSQLPAHEAVRVAVFHAAFS